MVKEIKVNYQSVNAYPLDVVETPPPEIIIDDDNTGDKISDSKFRVSQIIKYNEYLQDEIRKRQIIVKRFEYVEWVCFFIEIILMLSDFALGIFGNIFPQYSSIVSKSCTAFTAVSTCLRGFIYNTMNKLNRHKKILVLTQSKLAFFKDKYELAIDDGEVKHEEYSEIVKEFKKYEEMRRKFVTEN